MMWTYGNESSKDTIFSLETPCFIYSEAELRSNILCFKDAFETAWLFGSSLVGYSVKTAPILPLLSYAERIGCLAEVVSDDEFSLALEAGFLPENIIFNGPIKSQAWMDFAFSSGSIVNLDSWREIRYTTEYAQLHDKIPKVGLRINFDLESYCPGETMAGEEGGRFGFCYENGSLKTAIETLRSFGVELAGIHAHFSTKKHSLESYESITGAICKIVEEYSLNSLEYIDIGGGFYGGGENRSMYQDYATHITKGLGKISETQNVTLILEPGGSILCTPGEYVGRVIDSKCVKNRVFVVTELSKLNLNSTVFSRRGFACEVYYRRKTNAAPIQTLCGYTCIEMDRLCDLVDEPLLSEGDIVSIKNAGAYTVSFMPEFFIQAPPNIYLHTVDGEYVALGMRNRPKPPHADV